MYPGGAQDGGTCKYIHSSCIHSALGCPGAVGSQATSTASFQLSGNTFGKKLVTSSVGEMLQRLSWPVAAIAASLQQPEV